VVISRRRFLLGAALGAAGLTAARYTLPGRWATGPVKPLDQECRGFLASCLEGVIPSKMVDTHVHLAGREEALTGCWLHPDWQRHSSPMRRLRYDLFMGAAGVTREVGCDAQYVERLLERHRAGLPRGRLLLLAFDTYVDALGLEDRSLSAMHIPDDAVLDLAERHEDVLACASVHPYRNDAVERLRAAAGRGAVAVKWLPGVQGIDPAAPRCLPFYDAMAELGMPLITHAGEESALSFVSDEELGNPLRLRPALERGVRVVIAHAGSLGHVTDLDASSGRQGQLSCFDAFLRMFSEPEWERSLFADISALTFVNRSGLPLQTMLAASEWHHRLVNGSDYPLCALPVVNNSWWLEHNGLLSTEDRRLCDKIGEANPLLFDFVLKRSVRVLDRGLPRRFSPSVFEGEWLFDQVLG
jgi:predicted TIM-barrel fold metal-dependent hydrolase